MLLEIKSKIMFIWIMKKKKNHLISKIQFLFELSFLIKEQSFSGQFRQSNIFNSEQCQMGLMMVAIKDVNTHVKLTFWINCWMW